MYDGPGFNISLADAESWPAALQTVRKFLQSKRDLFDDLALFSVRIVLDIGVTVGEDKSYAPSIGIPKDVLSQLAALGVNPICRLIQQVTKADQPRERRCPIFGHR
jgi:hypothetical protein